MATMEALLVRIDHFHDRKLYVSTVKTWIEALGAPHGRIVTMGDVHLLFVEATPAQNDALLEKFATAHVDTNAKGEPCIDRFIDVVGRKPIEDAVCKGFLEMNILNATLLERLMVGDWHCDKQWLDDARSTPRTKALLQWKEEAKNARKDRRKRAAQDRDAERAAKRAKAEEDKAAAQADDAKEEDEEADQGEEQGDDAVTESAANTATPERRKKHAATPPSHTPVPPAPKAKAPPVPLAEKPKQTHDSSRPQKPSHGGGKKKKKHHKKV